MKYTTGLIFGGGAGCLLDVFPISPWLGPYIVGYLLPLMLPFGLCCGLVVGTLVVLVARLLIWWLNGGDQFPSFNPQASALFRAAESAPSEAIQQKRKPAIDDIYTPQ